MKTLLLFALLCTGTMAARAQAFINQSTCTLRIAVMCYDPASCVGALCASAITVPPFTAIPLPACVATCTGKTGYVVGYGPGMNCDFGLRIGDPDFPCNDYPSAIALHMCSDCSNFLMTMVSYDASGNLVARN